MKEDEFWAENEKKKKPKQNKNNEISFFQINTFQRS